MKKQILNLIFGLMVILTLQSNTFCAQPGQPIWQHKATVLTALGLTGLVGAHYGLKLYREREKLPTLMQECQTYRTTAQSQLLDKQTEEQEQNKITTTTELSTSLERLLQDLNQSSLTQSNISKDEDEVDSIKKQKKRVIQPIQSFITSSQLHVSELSTEFIRFKNHLPLCSQHESCNFCKQKITACKNLINKIKLQSASNIDSHLNKIQYIGAQNQMIGIYTTRKAQLDRYWSMAKVSAGVATVATGVYAWLNWFKK